MLIGKQLGGRVERVESRRTLEADLADGGRASQRNERESWVPSRRVGVRRGGPRGWEARMRWMSSFLGTEFPAAASSSRARGSLIATPMWPETVAPPQTRQAGPERFRGPRPPRLHGSPSSWQEACREGAVLPCESARPNAVVARSTTRQDRLPQTCRTKAYGTGGDRRPIPRCAPEHLLVDHAGSGGDSPAGMAGRRALRDQGLRRVPRRRNIARRGARLPPQ